MAPATTWRARLIAIAAVCGVVMLLGVLWLLREVGLFSNALSALLCLSAVLSLTRRALDVARRRVRLDVYRRPREHLPHLASMLLRFVAPLAFAWAADLAFVPAQFSDREALEYRVLVWVAAALLALSALAPRERAWAISDALFAAVLGFVSFDLVRASVEPGTADAVQIVSPFDTDALVMHGGASRLLNHHAALAQQAWALDLLPLTPDGKFWSGDKQRLESYPCFGAVLTSPVSGRVAHVRSDRPDMPVGQMDTEAITGNSISIEAAAGRYVVLAHLQAGSVRVTEGQHVAAGEPIARCGNSGHTTLPHLHLQAQSAPVLSNEDRQLRTYPLQLIEAERERGGSVAPAPFTVRRNDVIRPSRRHP